MRRRVALAARGVLRVLDTANVVPSSPNLVTLMMEALQSSEMSVLTKVTGRNIEVDGILHSHRRESLKSYIIHKKPTVAHLVRQSIAVFTKRLPRPT
jgi:hypothetical protein